MLTSAPLWEAHCKDCGKFLFAETEGWDWQWFSAPDGAPDGGTVERDHAVCQGCQDAAEEEFWASWNGPIPAAFASRALAQGGI